MKNETAYCQFAGVELEVYYSVRKSEPMTREYPGCPEEIEIYDVRFRYDKQDNLITLLTELDVMDKIEDAMEREEE